MDTMAAILKIDFSLFFLNRKAKWLEFGRKHKKLKLFRLEIQDGSHVTILKIYFVASSPEPKSHLTWNFVRIIEVSCRSKIVKIVPIGNTRWLSQLPSWKAFLNYFSWIEGQFSRNLIASIGMTCRSKIAKIILSEVQDGRPSSHVEKSIFHIIMNLGQNVCLGHLWVRFSKCYDTQVSVTVPSWPSCFS